MSLVSTIGSWAAPYTAMDEVYTKACARERAAALIRCVEATRLLR